MLDTLCRPARLLADTAPFSPPVLVKRLAMFERFLIGACTFAAMLALGASFANAEPLSADDTAFFENKIRPTLVKRCYECHSIESTELGGKLRLDSSEGIRSGGESGAAVSPGDPDASLIVQALRYDGTQMPPDGPLSDSEVNDFVEWVRRGAPDPRSEDTPRPVAPAPSPEQFWSFRTPVDPPAPVVQDADWPRGPIDRFARAAMEAAGESPVDDAEPRVLIRRLYFDLIGMPPTFDEVEAFVLDFTRSGQSAVERSVESLLGSPRFGERWGRHWLDVARYGESNGNDGLGRNPTFPHAWRYRDYVIEALNDDRPYDRFLAEQIAGDLLPSESAEERDRNLIATAFLALGAKPAKAMNDEFDLDVVADQIDAIGRGVLGLSVACARCHDHKFDPIPTRDYYALAGILTSSEALWGLSGHEGLSAPSTDLHVLQTAAKVPPPQGFVETVILLESDTGLPKAIPAPKWESGTPLAMGMRDRAEPADCKIRVNGESAKAGDAVPRGFLTALQDSVSEPIQIAPNESGRRQLAAWLTYPQNPLTARVMANRVWLHLFGEGIVRTPDDFGLYGDRPSHPALLDYLAVRLMEGGWSIKRLIREIVLSRTYQLASASSEERIQRDPQNRLFARHNRRRLDAEGLRDSMLAVGGRLDLRAADGSIIRHRDILVNLAGNLHQPSDLRSVYLCYLRSSPPPELAPFDLPDFVASVGRREVNTLPGQSLHLFNSPFVLDQSDALSQLVRASETEDQARVRYAFRRAFARDATPLEVGRSVGFVASVLSEGGAEEDAWFALCQALLMSNEFRYID